MKSNLSTTFDLRHVGSSKAYKRNQSIANAKTNTEQKRLQPGPGAY